MVKAFGDPAKMAGFLAGLPISGGKATRIPTLCRGYCRDAGSWAHDLVTGCPAFADSAEQAGIWQLPQDTLAFFIIPCLFHQFRGAYRVRVVVLAA